MKKRVLALCLSLCLVAGVFAGCGKDDEGGRSSKGSKKKDVTVQEVLEGMGNYDLQSAHADVKFDFAADATAMGQKMDVSVNADFGMDVEAEGDTKAGIKLDGNFDMNAMGQKESLPMEMYVTVDGEDFKIYLKSDELGSDWYDLSSAIDQDQIKEALEQAAGQDTKVEFSKDDPIVKNSKLTEENYNGVDCYKITYSDNLASYTDVIDEALKQENMSLDDIKSYGIEIEKALAEIKFDVVIYAATDDFAPVAVIFDMGSTNIESVLEASGYSLQTIGALAGVDISEVNLTACKFELTYSELGKVKVEIPDDVIENAVEYDAYSYGF